MFDRFERGTMSWGELRQLAAELGFSYLVNAMKRETGEPDAADESKMPPLAFNALRRLLHTPTVAAALEKESAHHTSAYQYKVIEKCMQLLIHGHFAMCDISEARLAYAYHCDSLNGVPCDLRTLSMALRLAKHAIAPAQLQTWMDAVREKLDLRTDSGKCYVQFREFLDLFVLATPVKTDRARLISKPKAETRQLKSWADISRSPGSAASAQIWEQRRGLSAGPHLGGAAAVAL